MQQRAGEGEKEGGRRERETRRETERGRDKERERERRRERETSREREKERKTRRERQGEREWSSGRRMPRPESTQHRNTEVVPSRGTSPRSWWGWRGIPRAMTSVLCCGDARSDGIRTESDEDGGRKRRSCRRMSYRCCTGGRAEQPYFYPNPVHCAAAEPELSNLIEVLVDKRPRTGESRARLPELHEQTGCDRSMQKTLPAQISAEHEIASPVHHARADGPRRLSVASTPLPSARSGGCPVAGLPVPPGHRCTWCHTIPHPGPSVFLELDEDNV